MNKTTRLKKPQIPELDKLYRFDDLGGRPKYGGVEMTSDTNIPDFDEIRDETHSMVVAEATARANADVALQNSISTVSSDLAAETSARVSADEAESTARQNADASEALARASADELEASTRQAADTNLQTQIDAIIASSDVKDVVATYAELEAYDTSTLGDNDIIKVLADETQGGAESYYRYHASTDQFTLIGTKAASYTKSETDTLLDTKVDKVTGKQLSTNDYTDAEKTKLAGIEAGAQVNKLDNVWSLPMTEAQWDEAITREAAGEPFIIKDFNSDTFRGKFATHVGRDTNNLKFIGLREMSDGTRYTPSVTVYTLAKNNGQYNLSSTNEYKIMTSIDNLTTAQSNRYSLDAHQGKVLKDLIDSLVIKNAGAPTTSTVGTIGQLLEDTTNGKLYQCTAIDNTDPQNIVYTWTEVGGGSGPAVVQTTGTSTTDVMSQNAVTGMVFADPQVKQQVKIGATTVSGNQAIGIGYNTSVSGNYSVGIGFQARAIARSSATLIGCNAEATHNFASVLGYDSDAGYYATALGAQASATGNGAIALGANSSAASQGQMDIGSSHTSCGYNNSNYRLLSGLYDPQNDHDAATKGYVDSHSATTLTNTEFNSILENA